MEMPSDLRLDSRRVGDSAVVAVRGDLDLVGAPELERALDGVRGTAPGLALDLREVDFMDTSGLRVVFKERELAMRGSYRFAVVRGPERVQRLFEIAGIPDSDSLFVDDPGALAGGEEP
jgi:anti-anti-sigma factor